MTINLPRLGKMLLGRKFLLYALGIVVAYVLDAWLQAASPSYSETGS